MTVQDLKTRFIWDLVVIYGDAQPERKAKFLDELSRIFKTSVNPILIGGDFNIIRKASEKNKPGTPGHWSFLFNAILEQAGVRELEITGREFTWGNNLPIPTFEKLDRILCSTEWEEVYPLTQITALTRGKSDHTPLFLDSGDIQKSDSIFTWFLREGIHKIIHDVWNDMSATGDIIDRLLGKLRLLRPKLKG